MSAEADAFKVLYPSQYFLQFFASGVRPDGRPLSRCRPTTVGFDAVSDADASALVKIGSTTALTTARIDVVYPTPSRPVPKAVRVSVHVTRLCDMDMGKVWHNELGETLSCRAQRLLDRAQLVDLNQFKIEDSPAYWSIRVDIHVLDADGSVFDTVLLACVGVLSSVRLPAPGDVALDELQRVTRQRKRKSEGRLLKLNCFPVALTCGLLKQHVVADPTAEEESVMKGFVTTVVDGNGDVLGEAETHIIIHQLSLPLNTSLPERGLGAAVQILFQASSPQHKIESVRKPFSSCVRVGFPLSYQ